MWHEKAVSNLQFHIERSMAVFGNMGWLDVAITTKISSLFISLSESENNKNIWTLFEGSKKNTYFVSPKTKKRRRKILDSFGCHRRPAPLEGRQPGPLYFRTISRRCEGSKRLRTLGVLAQEICVEITLASYIYILYIYIYPPGN